MKKSDNFARESKQEKTPVKKDSYCEYKETINDRSKELLPKKESSTSTL